MIWLDITDNFYLMSDILSELSEIAGCHLATSLFPSFFSLSLSLPLLLHSPSSHPFYLCNQINPVPLNLIMSLLFLPGKVSEPGIQGPS